MPTVISKKEGFIVSKSLAYFSTKSTMKFLAMYFPLILILSRKSL